MTQITTKIPHTSGTHKPEPLVEASPGLHFDTTFRCTQAGFQPENTRLIWTAMVKASYRGIIVQAASQIGIWNPSLFVPTENNPNVYQLTCQNCFIEPYVAPVRAQLLAQLNQILEDIRNAPMVDLLRKNQTLYQVNIQGKPCYFEHREKAQAIAQAYSDPDTPILQTLEDQTTVNINGTLHLVGPAVFSNLIDFNHYRTNSLREQALAKLSPEEQEALGLSKHVSP